MLHYETCLKCDTKCIFRHWNNQNLNNYKIWKTFHFVFCKITESKSKFLWSSIPFAEKYQKWNRRSFFIMFLKLLFDVLFLCLWFVFNKALCDDTYKVLYLKSLLTQSDSYLANSFHEDWMLFEVQGSSSFQEPVVRKISRLSRGCSVQSTWISLKLK